LQDGNAPADLQPTELVHEAWIRFAGKDATFGNRHQFFALAAKVMRSVLVDQARARAAQKRGGGARPITLEEDAGLVEGKGLDVLDLEQALLHLETLDGDLSRLVELRFFGGLSHPEIATLTGVPLRTVERRWHLARAWLRGELSA
jgi:RNA polymerase sigma-70 factor (ECF subfamily)